MFSLSGNCVPNVVLGTGVFYKTTTSLHSNKAKRTE